MSGIRPHMQNNQTYKTNRTAAAFLLTVWALLPLVALMPPIDWQAFVKSSIIAFQTGALLYLFLFRLTYVRINSDGTTVSSLLARKKRIRIVDITEIQRGTMYRGLSSFGYQAFVLYKSPDGSPEYFGMSENLYDLETVKALLGELVRRNKSVKIDPFYQRL